MKTGYGVSGDDTTVPFSLAQTQSTARAGIDINRARVSMGYLEEARQNHVKKKVEEALRSKMKEKALKECDHYASKYAECAMGKTLSVVWQCRSQAKELNSCLHQFTNDAVLEEMKQAYMEKEAKGPINV